MTDNLRDWRAELRLTQQQAADALGISRRYYIKLEHGDRPVNKRTLMACELLALNVRLGPPQPG